MWRKYYIILGLIFLILATTINADTIEEKELIPETSGDSLLDLLYNTGALIVNTIWSVFHALFIASSS